MKHLGGKKASRYVEVGTLNAYAGQDALVARIYSGTGAKRRLQTSLTLLPNMMGLDGPDFIPMGGSGQTNYIAPRGSMTRAGLESLSAKYGPGEFGFSTARSERRVTSIAQRNLEILKKYIEPKGQNPNNIKDGSIISLPPTVRPTGRSEMVRKKDTVS